MRSSSASAAIASIKSGLTFFFALRAVALVVRGQDGDVRAVRRAFHLSSAATSSKPNPRVFLQKSHRHKYRKRVTLPPNPITVGRSTTDYGLALPRTALEGP